MMQAFCYRILTWVYEKGVQDGVIKAHIAIADRQAKQAYKDVFEGSGIKNYLLPPVVNMIIRDIRPISQFSEARSEPK